MNEDTQTHTKSTLPSPIKDKSVILTDTSLKPFLEHIIAGASLSSTDVEAAFDRILAGADPVQVGALLAMLRQRGETPVEIAGMVRAMLKQRYPVNVTGKLLDIVGTGGDGAHTINISTAAIILAAACGCKAAKLGNRSVSSKCGSADVLEALGIDVELTAEQVAECIETTGVGFMFAPVVHPTMKKVAPVRKALGVRTAFNIVGPLLNAAGAQHAVVGVFQERLLDVLAGMCMCYVYVYVMFWSRYTYTHPHPPTHPHPHTNTHTHTHIHPQTQAPSKRSAPSTAPSSSTAPASTKSPL
jgi:anthranilate phosphoribosyltransferase